MFELDANVQRHLPLPKGWPASVRSSTVQAISLAHFSLTFARGVAANSINKRMRLQAEVDRLRQEIALLGEELRVKDARMLRIPAQRRPHYPLPVPVRASIASPSSSSPHSSITE